MKKILAINPVGTDIWDESDYSYFKKHASGDTEVEVVSLKDGPESVESYYLEAYASPRVLDIIKNADGRYDGFLVNCFADPGVRAAREITDVPVIGPGEASMLTASMLGHKFGVAAINKKQVAALDIKVMEMGIIQRFAGARAVNIGVSSLLDAPQETVEEVIKAADFLIRERGAEVIVLGCTGMAYLAEDIKKRLTVPVIEPALTALKLLETLIDMGLTHSKEALYSNPFKKQKKGD